MKLKKVAYPSSLPHFPLSSMHKVIGEAVLLIFFFKIAQLDLESCLLPPFHKSIRSGL